MYKGKIMLCLIISPNEKSAVIGDWLEGETREKLL
jgi:hypothetical protein